MVGIASNIVNPIIINSSVEAKKIKRYKKLGFISQTIQQIKDFKKIKLILKNKAEKFVSYNTICKATKKGKNQLMSLLKKWIL